MTTSSILDQQAATPNPYASLNGPARAGAKSTAGANGATATGAAGVKGAVAAGSDKKTVDPTSAEGIQNEFLTLLTTQLQTQDPTNPMDNSQITSQMAQISQVTGTQNLNQTMKSMLQSQMSSQSLLAANTVGRQALVSGNSIAWDGNTKGEPVVGAVSLAEAANKLSVTVANAQGQAVDSFEVEHPQVGMNAFSWDGTDASGKPQPAGSYTFNAVASQTGAKDPVPVDAQIYANQRINGVSMDGSAQPQLILGNGKRIGLSDVQQIS